MVKELPKTEAELQELLDANSKEVREAVAKEYDGKFAAQRTKHDQEIAKLKQDLGKSAEQLAEERIKEQQEKDANELAELRAFKKSSVLGEKLAKEGLPSYFKNDNRLLTAEEGDLDKVIKDVKKEYEATLPKGSQVSTVVKTGGATQPTTTPVDAANQALAQVLGDIVGK